MQIKKKHIHFGIIIIAILAVGLVYYAAQQKNEAIEKGALDEEPKASWIVDENGYLYYPDNREDVKFRREDYGIEGNISIHKIIYQSRNGNIYGLLVLPTSAEELLPGVVLLPGAGVSKESELGLAKKIAGLGAAVLTIDQRGVGETNGYFPALDGDYAGFLKGQEPVQHLMVYDALRAYDLLKKAPFTDSDRVIIAGESLGGRIAVIAAAIEKDINGVLAISSAGLGFEPKGDKSKDNFLLSIDSEHYIGMITPRKLVIMHNANDSNIPLSSAIRAFSKAEEPKQFVFVNDTACNHGYCDSMYDGLVDALDYLVDIKSRTLVSVPDR